MKKNPALKEFLQSLAKSDPDDLNRLLQREPDIAFEPAAIVGASLLGRTAVVRLLLRAGADPDAQTSSHEKYRALHRSIEHRGVLKNPGHLETVDLLLDAGADPEARSAWMGLTALATAGMAGDFEMIKAVLKRKPVMNLFHAAILGDVRQVKTILKKNPEAACEPDSNGMTPLHYAALSGLKEAPEQEKLGSIALLLCEAGADLNSNPKIGPYAKTSILHFAAWGSNIAVAKVLLERGTNPNLGFPNCLWRQPGALGELFVKHGADVNGREPSGQTLLHSRTHWNLTSVVLWLLEKGADPNLRDPEGNTPLHEAAKRGGVNIAKALLQHGAKKNLKNKAGATARDIAKRNKQRKFLVEIYAV